MLHKPTASQDQPHDKKQDKNEWWTGFFDDVFAAVVLERPDPQERADTNAFLARHLNLRAGDHVFDQCCGTGGVSIPLAHAGYRVSGVDIIPSYIETALLSAASEGVQGLCSFACADGRDYVPQGAPCDAVINWYTSFGYSPDDADNIRMLHCAAAALKEGGKIALDLTNMAASLRAAEQERHYTRDTAFGTVTVTRRYFFDLAAGMRGSVWRYVLPDGKIVEKTGSSRLYAPREIAAMLAQAGFENTVFYGDLNDGALGLDTVRCICIATKTHNL